MSNMPVVVIATKKGHYEKVVSNIQEIKSRKGKIIAIVNNGDVSVREIMDAEWGLSMRLDSTYAFPWNMTLGAIKDQ